MTRPYQDIYEHREDRPQEWEVLENPGPTPNSLLKVEWDPVTDTVRVSGPVVVHNPPHAPAP